MLLKPASGLILALSVLLTTTSSAAAQPWSMYSIQSQAGQPPQFAYAGFPYRFNRYPYDTTTYNSAICDPSCEGEGGPAGSCSIGIRQFYGGIVFNQGYFYAPDASYWDFQGHSVGKVLYDGTNRFLNPRDSQFYRFFMMFASQRVEGCARNGYGTAFSNDGITFTHGQQAVPLIEECDNAPPLPCGNFNWYCANGWPCQLSTPPYWWTTAEILAPLTYAGNMYAVGFLYNNDLADCSQENSICWPSNPRHAGTGAYLLQSSDGISWSRVYEPNGEFGRLSSNGIDVTRPCYGAAWLINVDLAYEPASQYFYMTRSYATNYGGDCRPEKLPDRIQLYRAAGANGVFYGPWELLFDGGCYNLGFQPDSASIVHDGLGNALVGPGGSITLMISTSHNATVCGRSTYPYHQVVVGP